MRVLLAGGGTAGHTSPLIATADALTRRDAEVQIRCVGTARGLETTVVPAAGYRLDLIPPVPLPRRPSVDLIKVPTRLSGAVRRTQEIIEDFDPDVIVGYGGYVSMPVYLAARRRRLPLVVHEQNALPGLANKVGARVADRVVVSFPDTALPKAEYHGLPIRRMISTLDRAAQRGTGREHFALLPDRPTLLVTGGSLGARRLNLSVGGAARELAGAGVQVLHVVGRQRVGAPTDLPTDPPYRVVDYVDRMDWAYAAADLVVCRAGASSVTEAAAVGLPAVFVPLPIGNGEQEFNARPVVAAGGGLLVADEDLTTDWVLATLPGLLGDRSRLDRMGAAAAALIPRDADERLARVIEETAR